MPRCDINFANAEITLIIIVRWVGVKIIVVMKSIDIITSNDVTNYISIMLLKDSLLNKII